MPDLPHAFPNASLCPLHCFTKRKNSVSPLLPFSPNGKIPRPHFCHFRQTEKFRKPTFAIFAKRKNSVSRFLPFSPNGKIPRPTFAIFAKRKNSAPPAAHRAGERANRKRHKLPKTTTAAKKGSLQTQTKTHEAKRHKSSIKIQSHFRHTASDTPYFSLNFLVLHGCFSYPTISSNKTLFNTLKQHTNFSQNFPPFAHEN